MQDVTTILPIALSSYIFTNDIFILFEKSEKKILGFERGWFPRMTFLNTSFC